jgi:hypothetical protein
VPNYKKTFRIGGSFSFFDNDLDNNIQRKASLDSREAFCGGSLDLAESKNPVFDEPCVFFKIQTGAYL